MARICAKAPRPGARRAGTAGRGRVETAHLPRSRRRGPSPCAPGRAASAARRCRSRAGCGIGCRPRYARHRSVAHDGSDGRCRTSGHRPSLPRPSAGASSAGAPTPCSRSASRQSPRSRPQTADAPSCAICLAMAPRQVGSPSSSQIGFHGAHPRWRSRARTVGWNSQRGALMQPRMHAPDSTTARIGISPVVTPARRSRRGAPGIGARDDDGEQNRDEAACVERGLRDRVVGGNAAAVQGFTARLGFAAVLRDPRCGMALLDRFRMTDQSPSSPAPAWHPAAGIARRARRDGAPTSCYCAARTEGEIAARLADAVRLRPSARCPSRAARLPTSHQLEALPPRRGDVRPLSRRPREQRRQLPADVDRRTRLPRELGMVHEVQHVTSRLLPS